MNKPLTAERLRQLLDYDPESGRLVWRVYRNQMAVPGTVAGAVNSQGYLTIKVEGKNYQSHRIIWLHVHGAWPSEHMDHANGDKLDNRLINLRPASRSQNMGNKRLAKINKAGLKGASPIGNRWRAKIQKDGVAVVLGHFATPQEAHEAYVAAAKRLHGEFARAA